MSGLPGHLPGWTSRVADAASGALRPAGVREVLQNRNFLFLWMAQLFSQTAQNAIFLILLYIIEERTGSTALAGLMVVTFIIPTIVLGIGAGVLVDRMNKKTVLVWTNLARAVVTLGFIAFGDSVAPLFVVNFLFACISQFFAPAEAATIPALVQRHQLISANGLFNITISFAQLLGFIIFGPTLIALFGAVPTFLAIAAIYLFCAGLCQLLPPDRQIRRTAVSLDAETRNSLVRSVVAEVREGFGLLTGERRIAIAMVHLALGNGMILVLATIAPGFVSRIVGVSVEGAVLLLAPAFFGIVGGTLIMPVLARRLDNPSLVRIGLVGMAGGLFVLGLLEFLLRSLAANPEMAAGPAGFLAAPGGIQVTIGVFAVIIGLGYAFINVPSQTILMERTPPDMRGRIFAVQLTFSFMVSVIPLLFAGSAADLFGIGVVLVTLGVLVVVVLAWTLWQERRLRGGAEPPAQGQSFTNLPGPP